MASAGMIAMLVLLVILPITECAQFCYSGRGHSYGRRQCSSGGQKTDYVCQTFTCEGGKSPFVLRTCANPSMGCMAGPAICKYSGGSGSCARCDNDNLPPKSIDYRDCSLNATDRCSEGASSCSTSGGIGSCLICREDDCNITSPSSLPSPALSFLIAIFFSLSLVFSHL